MYWILPCDATGAKVSSNPLWKRNWTPCNFGFRGWWIWSQPPARACQGSTAPTMGRTRECASSKTFHNEIRSQPMDGKCLRMPEMVPLSSSLPSCFHGYFRMILQFYISWIAMLPSRRPQVSQWSVVAHPPIAPALPMAYLQMTYIDLLIKNGDFPYLKLPIRVTHGNPNDHKQGRLGGVRLATDQAMQELHRSNRSFFFQRVDVRSKKNQNQDPQMHQTWSEDSEGDADTEREREKNESICYI